MSYSNKLRDQPVDALDEEGFIENAPQRNSKVQFFCRIKPPINQKNVSIENREFTIFSASEEVGKTIIAARNGIRSRLIDNYYRKEEDVENIRQVYQDKIDTFKFNACVFNHAASQEQVYRTTCRDFCNEAIKGSNSTVCIYGPQNCGKTHTLAGGEKNDKGLAFRACEDLIAKIQIQNENQKQNKSTFQHHLSLSVSIFCIYNDEIKDLLNAEQGTRQSVKDVIDSKIIGLTKKDIQYKNDFKTIYQSATSNLIQLSEQLKDKLLFARSHFFIQFSVNNSIIDEHEFKNSNSTKLTIVRLADIDVFQPATEEAELNDFFILQKYVAYCCKNNDPKPGYSLYKSSKLTSCLRETMNETTQSSFICCVGSQQDTFQQSFFSLEFCEKLQLESKGLIQHNIDSSQRLGTFQPQQQQQFQQQQQHPQNAIYSPSTKPFTSSESKQSLVFRKKNLDQIQAEADELVTVINQNIDIVSRFSEKQKFEWIQQREQNLTDLSRQLDAASVGTQNNPQVSMCEQLLLKAQQLLKKINLGGGNDTGILSRSQRNTETAEAIEKLVSREQRLRQIRQSESLSPQKDTQHQTPYSPTRSNVEQIKQKEEKLDKDFVRLLERYNHSKELIDNLSLTNQQLQQPQQQQQQETFIVNSNVYNSKKNSPVKFADTASVAALQRSAAFSPQQQRNVAVDQGITDYSSYSVKNKRRIDRDFGQDNVKASQSAFLGGDIVGGGGSTGAKEQKIQKSLSKLKQTIAIKEDMERDKFDKLKKLNKELKATLKEFVFRSQEQEQGLKLKDELLFKYEQEIKNCQQDLLLNIDRIKEMKIKEEGWIKLEEELRESILSYKGKLARKKKKLGAIKQEIQTKESVYKEQIENQRVQIDKLQVEHEELKNKHEKIFSKNQDENSMIQNYQQETEKREEQIQLQEQEIGQLKKKVEEVVQRLQQEEQQKAELITLSENQKEKATELSIQVNQLEAKIQKQKTKFEEEKRQILEEKLKEIQKKATKLQKFKTKSQEQEKQLLEHEKEKLIAAQQSERMQFQINDQEKQIEQFKEERSKLYLDLQATRENNTNLLDEVQRLQTIITSLESRIKLADEVSQRDSKTINDYKLELAQCSDQLERLKEANSQLESQMDFLQKQQNIEINEIENRLEQFLQEIKQLKEENTELKRSEVEFKKKLLSIEDALQTVKEKYQKSKQQNKLLRAHNKEVEDKVKEYMQERAYEIKELDQLKQQQKAAEQNNKTKIKLLDEIQGLIKDHKSKIANKYD